MREIKFRGLYDGKWIYGYLIKEKRKKIFSIYSDDLADERSFPVFEVDPKTVGQYMGQNDKKNQELFDGDIVKVPPNHIFDIKYRLGRICYDDFSVPCLVRNDYPEIIDFAEIGAKGGFNQIEKIGNIHDNPELLGRKE